jgi:tetratricopeptide (TPR) repeat protein
MMKAARLLGCCVAFWSVASVSGAVNPATQQPASRAKLAAARFLRETNSHAATRRGVKQFNAKQYAGAADSLRRAEELAPTAAHAFNLGTAEIAAGRREEGSSTLAKAMADPTLRADALYNRGSSALGANAFDYAIRDFSESLRLRPGDPAAKRNLEIALARKRAMKEQQQRQRAGGKQQPDQKQQAPSPGDDEKQRGDPNLDALLRSVQQQEQEELQRMHKPRPEKLHVGW